MGRRHWLRQLSDEELADRMADALVEMMLCCFAEEAVRWHHDARRYCEEYSRRHRRNRPLGCTCRDCVRSWPEAPLVEQLPMDGDTPPRF